jgi:hypothetical protein
MALMCGDQYAMELPVAPLLNHQCCYVTDLERGLPAITLETYLGECKRKVEVTVASYHRAAAPLTDSLFHGAVLVYMAKRKASLMHLGYDASHMHIISILLFDEITSSKLVPIMAYPKK